MRVVLIYKPDPRVQTSFPFTSSFTIGNILGREFANLDTLVFDREFVLSHLDQTFDGLKDAVRDKSRQLTESQLNQLIEVFGTLLLTERELVMVDDFIRCPEDAVFWTKFFKGNSVFLFYDCLYLPHEDTCTHIDAIYPLATPAGVHVIVSSGNLIHFVSAELRQSGVRRLPRIPA